MSGTIYYFSGTGNSLMVARDIANRLNAQLVPIASVIGMESIGTSPDATGIVFPVYHQRIPHIVKRFAEKLEMTAGNYIFGICTYGGSPATSLGYLDGLLRARGGRLSAGFAVRMPYNYITPSFTLKGFLSSFKLREVSPGKQNRMYSDWQARLEGICQTISERRKTKLVLKARAIEHLVDSLGLRDTLQKKAWLKIAGFKGSPPLSFFESLKLMDHGFSCDSKCNGCGLCSRICPVGNIVMNDGRPVWQHRCEQCFACLQWCPKEAVQFGPGTSSGKRYRNPGIRMVEMLPSAPGTFES